MLPQLLCAAVCLGAEPRATPPDISQLAETISTNVKKGPLKGAIRVYQAFNSLFANSDEAMLAELLAHRDRSIALQSVWRMQRYKPQRSFDPTNRYYLPHFIESEIGIRVPAVWAVQVAELYPFRSAVTIKSKLVHRLAYGLYGRVVVSHTKGLPPRALILSARVRA